MTAVPEFLLIDDNADNRFLLAKTLLRKFPNALIQECQDSEPTLQAAKRPTVSAAIVHRALDMDGLELVTTLRSTHPTLPILYVSGADRRAEALRAGASEFLNYDAWLNVATTVASLLPPPAER